MNAVASPAPSAAPKAAWVCLAIAWVAFLVPIPGLGFIGWALNLVAFILAIVAMSRAGAGAGLWQLLASIVVSPIVYFIGLAVLAGTIGAVSNAHQGNTAASATPTKPQEQTATSAVAVDARALFAAYDANEVAADQEFKGKRLYITGTVESIASDLTDDAVVNLKGGDFQTVDLRGLDKATAAGLAKGQQITAICTGAGEVIGSPMLDDCAMQ